MQNHWSFSSTVQEVVNFCWKCSSPQPGADFVPADFVCPECGAVCHPGETGRQLPAIRHGRLTIHGADLSFRFFPAGVFLRGGDGFYPESSPRHRVVLSRPFWMAETPVTQDSFEGIKGFNPSRNRGGSLPVENLSWHQAADYCYCLADQARNENELPESWDCRLPTEAEWEFACAISLGALQPAALKTVGWYSGNSGGSTHPVGERPEQACRLYDILGNVREWCLDWMSAYTTAECFDPMGPATGDRKVVRGGSFLSSRVRCTPVDRISLPSFARSPAVGFRPVLVPSDA